MRDFRSCKGYIFDLDGTLFDSMGLWAEVYRTALRRFGVEEVPADYIREVNCRSVTGGALYTAERFGLPASAEDVIAVWKSIAGDAYASTVELKEGAAELLASLRAAGKKIGIATALDESLALPCFRRHGIPDVVHSFSTVAEAGKDKNFPDVYLLECEKLGLKPEECAVIEDSITGASTAAKAGFFTVGVTDAHADCPPEELAAVTDVCVDSLAQLADVADKEGF